MTETLAEFDRQEPIAYVEIDRYCDGCGYNLRTQPVRRDARTELLLCRCPECGKFHAARDTVTAGRVWLQRLGTLGLMIWVLAILAAALGLGGAQVGVSYGVLEELTTFTKVTVPVAPPPPVTTTTQPGAATQPATQPAAAAKSAAQVERERALAQLEKNLTALNIQLSGPTLTLTTPGSVTTTTTWKREVREEYEHYGWFVLAVCAVCTALGFLLTMFAATVMHHWRRWGYWTIAVFVPIAAALIAWFAWWIDFPYLSDWALRYITLLAGLHLLGGTVGVYLGRPLARLIATLTLPPRLRQVLAFLWLADGKTPPAVVRDSR